MASIAQPQTTIPVGHQTRTLVQLICRRLSKNQVRSLHNPQQAKANARPTSIVCRLSVSSPVSRGSHVTVLCSCPRATPSDTTRTNAARQTRWQLPIPPIGHRCHSKRTTAQRSRLTQCRMSLPISARERLRCVSHTRTIDVR
jgi:hypothetical protein